MICLDTDYLIRGIVEGTREAARLTAWARSGETLITPALAWFEFLCGPVTPAQTSILRAFLAEIVPFEEVQAVEAARLFNAVNRLRRLRVDAMIAATATAARARLATNNRPDFERFTRHGLELI